VGAASAADATKFSPRECPGPACPPTIVASPSLSTRITVGGCRRTYTAKAKELKAITPNTIASTIERFAYARNMPSCS
jgi:hypothetical protein